MFHRISTNTLNWIMIIGILLFVLEIAFFHGGMLVPAIVSAFAIYMGWKNYYQLWGTIIFWMGIIGLIFSILNMMAVRFLLIAGIVLFIREYMKKKKSAEFIKPVQSNEIPIAEPLVEVKPLFDHTMFGEQRTSDYAYKWRDINIYGVFGDRIIDLSNTVLPNETAVISIRHFVGNIDIYVPYEVEVSVHHSSIFGRATIFGNEHWKLMNQSLLYKTKNYDTTYPRVKIVTSLISGDIEVKRI